MSEKTKEKAPENPNLNIWNFLYKTPKEHTKEFKRKGGFQGTAIKPMFSIQQMTDRFGACGIGWGYTKPEYEVTTEQDGQKLVYCTVGLWYLVGSKKSELVWGVGGDYVVSKGQYGLSPDDEAYKKSFTDALMNAMKHLGMGGEIHMGQFDGNKYTEDKKDNSVKVPPKEQDKPVKTSSRMTQARALYSQLFKEKDASLFMDQWQLNIAFITSLGQSDDKDELQAHSEMVKLMRKAEEKLLGGAQ